MRTPRTRFFTSTDIGKPFDDTSSSDETLNKDREEESSTPEPREHCRYPPSHETLDREEESSTSEPRYHCHYPPLQGHSSERVDASQNEVEAVLEVQPGVAKMRALNLVIAKRADYWWMLHGSLAIVICTLCLKDSTVRSYLPTAASAYDNHALISLISIIEHIANAVSRPIFAKICDVSSRHSAYVGVMVTFVMGYCMVAGSHSVTTLCLGRLVSAVGEAGLDLVTDIILSDLSSIQSRGVTAALQHSPNIVFALVGGKIAGALLRIDAWRYGYGLLAVLIPIAISPLLLVLYRADRLNESRGDYSLLSVNGEADSTMHLYLRDTWDRYSPRTSWKMLLYSFAVDVDAVGLLLLSIGFASVLFPLTLQPVMLETLDDFPMLATFTAGCIILVAFPLWEMRYASKPVMPRHIVTDRTIQLVFFIELFYYLSATLKGLYYSSYVFVIKVGKDWSEPTWAMFNNLPTLCVAASFLVAGGVMRYTHRYKYLQLFGLTVRLGGLALCYRARGDKASDFGIVSSIVLMYSAGAFSALTSRVAVQASVRHRDLACVTALLGLWCGLAGAIGACVGGVMWATEMPRSLEHELQGAPASVIVRLYGSINDVRSPQYSQYRDGVIRAYDGTIGHTLMVALLLSAISLFASFLMPNRFLGESHNLVENLDVAGRKLTDTNDSNDRAMEAVDESDLARNLLV